MVEGGMKCVKYLIFFFNFIFVISGIALVTLGAVIKGYYNKYLDFLGDGVVGAPILLIIVGVVIFFVAFMGCCGAIRESYCMTMTFAVLLALIFILELAAGITAYVLRDDIRTTLNTNMQATMQNYGKDDYDGVTKTWDGVQMELDCCGISNYTNWANTSFGSDGDRVPDTCCLIFSTGCGAGVAVLPQSEAAQTIHTAGCLYKLEEEMKENIVAVGGAGVGVAFLQILGVILACCLSKSIKKEYETV
ncbi:CD63 antigen-like isoform X2 [Amphibalanus amphitrite]|uniref:CD63 antigen-like isoform X2 n=1 Tax=Amphibalanus amphitrite TaxID=1232801 RepID=UPI001C92769D|nr:CD63 antigen-like isoform X2 [Amphibalanus amphitrite]